MPHLLGPTEVFSYFAYSFFLGLYKNNLSCLNCLCSTKTKKIITQHRILNQQFWTLYPGITMEVFTNILPPLEVRVFFLLLFQVKLGISIVSKFIQVFQMWSHVPKTQQKFWTFFFGTVWNKEECYQTLTRTNPIYFMLTLSFWD